MNRSIGQRPELSGFQFDLPISLRYKRFFIERRSFRVAQHKRIFMALNYWNFNALKVSDQPFSLYSVSELHTLILFSKTQQVLISPMSRVPELKACGEPLNPRAHCQAEFWGGKTSPMLYSPTGGALRTIYVFSFHVVGVCLEITILADDRDRRCSVKHQNLVFEYVFRSEKLNRDIYKILTLTESQNFNQGIVIKSYGVVWLVILVPITYNKQYRK